MSEYNTLEYKDSWVQFRDCIEGMKELEDKSIDLCLTDPPWNIGFTLMKGSHYTGENHKNKIFYQDEIDNYLE